jgi:hypothetical protein
MGLSIKLPWSIHLRGSGVSSGRSWWLRRKRHDDSAEEDGYLKEEDLDHLGALHDADGHPNKD